MQETCDSFVSCPSPVIPVPGGVKIASIQGSDCCDGFRDTKAGRDEPCCGVPVYEMVTCSPPPVCCPEGFVPEIPSIVLLAKHSPLFSSLFGCYPEEALHRYLCCMEQYRLPGCEDGDLSVVLAAAHFFTVQTAIHRGMQSTMGVQASKGKPLEPLSFPDPANIKAGDEQWLLTSYGIQYREQFKRPVVALLGMAWGI